MSEELPAGGRGPGCRGAWPGRHVGDSALTCQEFAAIRGVGFEPVGQVFGAAVYAAGYAAGIAVPGRWGSSGGTRPARPADPGIGAGRCGVVRAAGGGHVPGPADGHRPDDRRVRRAGRARGGRRPAVPGGRFPSAGWISRPSAPRFARRVPRTGSGRFLPAMCPGRSSPS